MKEKKVKKVKKEVKKRQPNKILCHKCLEIYLAKELFTVEICEGTQTHCIPVCKKCLSEFEGKKHNNWPKFPEKE